MGYFDRIRNCEYEYISHLFGVYHLIECVYCGESIVVKEVSDEKTLPNYEQRRIFKIDNVELIEECTKVEFLVRCN